MATFNADIANTPPRAPRFGGLISRVATLTFSSFTQATDDIAFLTIPKGATLVDMTVTTDTVGQTVDVGSGADDDRFIAAAADDTLTRISLVAGIDFTFTADTVITGVVNTGDPTDDGVVVLRVSYVLTP